MSLSQSLVAGEDCHPAAVPLRRGTQALAAVRLLLIAATVLGFALLAPLLRLLGPRADAGLAAKLARLFCRMLLALLRVRVVVAAGAALSASRLLVANHVSWIDVLVLGSREPLCFVAKREVVSWPLVGSLARLAGTVFVDRARRRALLQVNRAMAARLGAGRSVLLFPEGTTHDGTRRGRFLTSHLACLRDRLAAAPDVTACPVQAVAITYSGAHAAWIGDDTLLPHLWRVLRRPPLSCALAYAIPRDVGRGDDRKVLGRALAADVEHLLRDRPSSPPAVTAGAVLAKA